MYKSFTANSIDFYLLSILMVGKQIVALDAYGNFDGISLQIAHTDFDHIRIRCQKTNLDQAFSCRLTSLDSFSRWCLPRHSSGEVALPVPNLQGDAGEEWS